MAFTAAVLLAGCGGDDEPEASPSPGSPATSGGAPSEWNAAAVWDEEGYAEAVVQECGGPDPECGRRLAIERGASPEAVAFLDAYEYFLTAFEERGTVDTGVIAAPWANMNRPELVFLNGDFGLSGPEPLLPDDWEEELPEDAPQGGLLWREEAVLVEATDEASGQRFRVELPYRECRACPDFGHLVVDYAFDDTGAFSSAEVVEFRRS
jgi:hypothetical protein